MTDPQAAQKQEVLGHVWMSSHSEDTFHDLNMDKQVVEGQETRRSSQSANPIELNMSLVFCLASWGFVRMKTVGENSVAFTYHS